MWLVRGLQAVNLDNVDSLNVQDKEIRITFHNGKVWIWVFESKEVALANFTTLLINMKMGDEEVISVED